MKLICIKENWVANDKTKAAVAPSIGEECIVLTTFERDGIEAYQLKGYPPENGYKTSHFAPSSDIDETTFERNFDYKKLICLKENGFGL